MRNDFMLTSVDFVRVFMFGFLCPVRVGKILKCGEIVEKLWDNMWESQWKMCGKSGGKEHESGFYTKSGKFLRVFHAMVEKFCNRFTQGFFPVITGISTVSTGLTITTINILGGLGLEQVERLETLTLNAQETNHLKESV